ncbi:hypothetical protein KGD03_000830 [Enterococcus hirae]|nr:hypothetical protein [Enterococcus hirae]EMF0297532.1 hypothetical protein [Enterococcus hirae]
MLDKVLEVNGILVTLGAGSIFSLICKLFKQLKVQRQKTEERFQKIESANLALLHDKIYQQCSYFLEKGWVSIDDLENLEYIWKGYKELGGNGTGEALYNKVIALPNKSVMEEKE